MPSHLERYGWDNSYFPRLNYVPSTAPGSDGDYAIRKTGSTYTWTPSSSGPRPVDLVGSFSASNYYEAPNTAWRGGTAFGLACLVFTHWATTADTQNICGNLDPAAGGGWAFALAGGASPAHTSVSFLVEDGSSLRTAAATLANPAVVTGDAGGGLTHNKLIVVHGLWYDNGGVTDLRLYIQGGLVHVLPGVDANHSPGTHVFRIGRAPGSTAYQFDTGYVQGVGLVEAEYGVDFDDEDIRDHFYDIVTAGGMVDFSPAAFDNMVTADGFAGTTPSTWTNQGGDGSAGDLTKAGSPTARTIPEMW